MPFCELTPNAEKLLQEILDHRNENEICDTYYWDKRFDSLDYAADTQLRSIFKELSDAEMISTQWASNGPFDMTILNNGLSYFDMKAEKEKREKKAKNADRWHDLQMIVLGAILGGVVEYLLFKLFGIGG